MWSMGDEIGSPPRDSRLPKFVVRKDWEIKRSSVSFYGPNGKNPADGRVTK